MNKVTFRNKERYINYDSFTVNSPGGEFMADITEMGYLNGEYKYLSVCIDIFQSMPVPLTCQIKTPIQAHIYYKMCLKKMECLRQSPQMVEENLKEDLKRY